MLDVEEKRKIGGSQENINNQSALEAMQFPNYMYLTLSMSEVSNGARMSMSLYPFPFWTRNYIYTG